jgi:hypothetical protein
MKETRQIPKARVLGFSSFDIQAASRRAPAYNTAACPDTTVCTYNLPYNS